MKEELKTYRISIEITTNTHPKKWFEEAMLDNLFEYGEGFVAPPEYEEIETYICTWLIKSISIQTLLI